MMTFFHDDSHGTEKYAAQPFSLRQAFSPANLVRKIARGYVTEEAS